MNLDINKNSGYKKVRSFSSDFSSRQSISEKPQEKKARGCATPFIFLKNKINEFMENRKQIAEYEGANGLNHLERNALKNLKGGANEQETFLSLRSLNVFLDMESYKGSISDLARAKLEAAKLPALKSDYMNRPEVKENPDLKRYCEKTIQRVEIVCHSPERSAHLMQPTSLHSEEDLVLKSFNLKPDSDLSTFHSARQANMLLNKHADKSAHENYSPIEKLGIGPAPLTNRLFSTSQINIMQQNLDKLKLYQSTAQTDQKPDFNHYVDHTIKRLEYVLNKTKGDERVDTMYQPVREKINFSDL